MKKAIYVLLFAIVASMSISSCTEETIVPKKETDNSGGLASDPLTKK